ncbi:MAG: malate dehydrogenase [Thermoplasmata archaeon]
MKHIAIVGVGRVGSALAYTLAFKKWVKKLTLVDIKPEIAEMTKEEIHHGLAFHGLDLEIDAFADASEIKSPDLVVVSAGAARMPGMSRRDLAAKNAAIVRDVVAGAKSANPSAKFFVITNPVDAMTTLAEQIAGRKNVAGTGTCLETARFKTILARELCVSIADIEGFVGGEHGEACVPLWSSVKVKGISLQEFLEQTGKNLDRKKCEDYIKNVSMKVIEATGGTRWGPAGAFVEIIEGLLLHTGRVLPFSTAIEISGIEIPVHVTVPGKIGFEKEISLWNLLSQEEKEKIIEAGRAIYQTYQKAIL